MASDHDVQDFTTHVKKRKIEHFSSSPAAKDPEYDFKLFSQNGAAPSTSETESKNNYLKNRDQISTGRDSGFSEMGVQKLNDCKDAIGSYPDYEESSLYENNIQTSTAEPIETSCVVQSAECGDDDDDISSTISDLSGISGLSHQDWKPAAGPMSWVQRQMANGTNPRELLEHIVQDESVMASLPAAMDDLTLWKIIVSILSEPPRRKKLPHVNTLSDFVDLLRTCSNIIVLTGAGVSVSCGIPDFRSHDGIYSRLAVDFPNLPNPQAMFDINYFNKDPRPFFKFAKEIYPGKFKPSPCHKFIKALETKGKLLRNYTQNIDTLEQVTGIKKVVQCHGSFATASCTRCKHKVDADEIRENIYSQTIPVCRVCSEDKLPSMGEKMETNVCDLVRNGIMKPDIVFFCEGLPDHFHEAMAADKDKCDLLIVIGSSLKVDPVALIPSSIPKNVPQVLINREPLGLNFDIELLGNGDVIIDQVCRMLGDDWTDLCWLEDGLTETTELLPLSRTPPSSAGDSSRKRASSETEDCDQQVASPVKKLKVDEVLLSQSMRDVRVCSVDSVLTEDSGTCCELATTPSSTSTTCPSSIKHRQMSMDSGTRDSGISEVNNTDHLQCVGGGVSGGSGSSGVSFSQLLPHKTYYFEPPNRYVFEGAEVYNSKNKVRSSRTSSRESVEDDEEEEEEEEEDEETSDSSRLSCTTSSSCNVTREQPPPDIDVT